MASSTLVSALVNQLALPRCIPRNSLLQGISSCYFAEDVKSHDLLLQRLGTQRPAGAPVNLKPWESGKLRAEKRVSSHSVRWVANSPPSSAFSALYFVVVVQLLSLIWLWPMNSSTLALNKLDAHSHWRGQISSLSPLDSKLISSGNIRTGTPRNNI